MEFINFCVGEGIGKDGMMEKQDRKGRKDSRRNEKKYN
jgi:hypothetical protein